MKWTVQRKARQDVRSNPSGNCPEEPPCLILEQLLTEFLNAVLTSKLCLPTCNSLCALIEVMLEGRTRLSGGAGCV